MEALSSEPGDLPLSLPRRLGRAPCRPDETSDASIETVAEQQETNMYYSKGNYEAFARPRKPANVETKSAYLVGGGLASLAAAAFLVRDGHMAGDRITILEASTIGGGALDGAGNAETGWLIRGGREMEDHFECLWDLYRSIPETLEVVLHLAATADQPAGF